jgi:hypothetical protein
LIKEQSEETETKKFETVTQNVKKKLGFRLFFVGNKDWDVEVAEVDEIDFADVKRRLECGESIFIARIQRQKSKPILSTKIEKEPWYFPHS